MSLLNKDVLSGALFVAVGLAGLYIGWDYAVGTAFRMGPGYFPRVLCGFLVVLGIVIAAKGVVAGGELPDRLHFRPLVMVTLAVLAFAGLLATIGLLPAALAVILLSAIGGPEFRWGEGILLSIVLSAGAIALFKYGLNMTMPIIDLSQLGLIRL